MTTAPFGPAAPPFPVDAGRVFPMLYTGAGATWKQSQGLGVMASVNVDSTWRMGFLMPTVLPTGTLALRLWARANAVSGVAKVNVKWAMCGSGANPSAVTLNSEGTRDLTWAAGDADKFKLLTIVLDVVSAQAGQMLLLDLIFETNGWTLAAQSSWLPFLEFATSVVDSQPSAGTVGMGVAANLSVNLLGGVDYFVNIATGNDANAGTSLSAPLKTIGAGVAKLSQHTTGGDRVIVYPGVYRERVLFNKRGGVSGRPNAVCGSRTGAVQMKASDLVTGWVIDTGSVWKKTGWTTNSQQVFVNGSPLQQIGSTNPFNSDGTLPPVGTGRSSMTAGSFFRDSATSTLYVWLANSGDPNGATMEASVRTNCFEMQYDTNNLFLNDFFEVHDMEFYHGNGTSGGRRAGCVDFTANDWMVSDCKVYYGDFTGIQANGYRLQFYRCDASFNGDVGITHTYGASGPLGDDSTVPMLPPTNSLMQDCITNNNNYRHFNVFWASGGMKHFVRGLTVRNCTANNNYGYGIWFDGHSRECIVENCSVNNNTEVGIFDELNDLGCTFRFNTITNCNMGIDVTDTSFHTSHDNTITGCNWGIRHIENPRLPLANNHFLNNTITNSGSIDLLWAQKNGGNTIDFTKYHSTALGHPRFAYNGYSVTQNDLPSFRAVSGQEANGSYV